jgi:hypothetical protein
VVILKDLVFPKPRRKTAQEPEAPAEKEADPAKLLQAALAENADLLAHGFVLGIALVLVKGGLATKADLKKLKPQSIVSGLQRILKGVVQERQVINQELRLLWRLGAGPYLVRKSRQLKELA